MAFRYAFRTEYDGSAFNGWQIQPPEKAKKTVQGILEAAIRVANPEFTSHISGAGRTDTGVHASGQWFHADFETELDLYRWVHKINGILGNEPVAVLEGFAVTSGFHARFSALSRTYEYTLNSLPSPLNRHQEWFYPWPVHFSLLDEYAGCILKQSDFSSFCKAGDESETKVCKILSTGWHREDSRFRFRITANRFLYGMVRALTGAQLHAMRHGMSPVDFENLFLNSTRSSSGPAAKAHGLNLTQVSYPDHLFLK